MTYTNMVKNIVAIAMKEANIPYKDIEPLSVYIYNSPDGMGIDFKYKDNYETKEIGLFPMPRMSINEFIYHHKIKTMVSGIRTLSWDKEFEDIIFLELEGE